MSKIFISYARKDKDEVYPIVDEIERNGFDCWIDKNGIESGSVFKKVIISAINECEVFVYMFSKNAFESEWVDKEYDQAKAKGKHIIPVMLKDAANNEDIMFDFRRIDYIDTCKEGWQEKLIRDLKNLLGNTAGNLDISQDHVALQNQNTEPSNAQNSLDKSDTTEPFSMTIETKYYHERGVSTNVTGHVKSGIVRVNDTIRLKNNWKKCKVLAINKINRIKSEKRPFSLFSYSSVSSYVRYKRKKLESASMSDGEIEMLITIPASEISVNDELRSLDFHK